MKSISPYMYRRQALGLGAIIAGAGLTQACLGADKGALQPSSFNQGAGVYMHRVGAYEITVLSDGAIRLPAWPTFGANVAGEAEVLAAFRLWNEEVPQALLHVNMLLIRGAGRCILIDTGYGPRQTLRPGGGQLQRNLLAAGISADEIDTVVITHAHPDHLWGVFDGDRRIFSRARHLMNREEREPWLLSDAQLAIKPEKVRAMLRTNRDTLERFLGFAELIERDAEIAPGIHLYPLPGHTPGHAGVELVSEGASLLHCTDAIPHPRLQLDHPEWHYSFDSNPSQAVETRLALIKRLANTNTLVSGCHFGFPALGHIAAESERARFIPILWEWK